MKIIVWKEDLLEILRETKNFFEVGSTSIDAQGEKMEEPEYWVNHLYE